MFARTDFEQMKEEEKIQHRIRNKENIRIYQSIIWCVLRRSIIYTITDKTILETTTPNA